MRSTLIALLGAALALLPAARSSAAADSFDKGYEKASFCAAATLASLPSPDESKAYNPAILAVLQASAQRWIGAAAAEGAKAGRDARAVFEDVNGQNQTIHEAFRNRSAPFFDLVVCDDVHPSVLWESVPATRGTMERGNDPRNGAVSLDRLADRREVDIYQSTTGRLRPYYADISAAEAFARDVRILALEHALRQPGVPPDLAGTLQWELAEDYGNRRIGIDARNDEREIAAYQAAAAALPADGIGRALVLKGLCFAWFQRLAGDRADNLERAIDACEHALPLLDHDRTREPWADTQLILAGALHDRMRGERAQNIENAIIADRAALSVRSREKDPGLWATTQNNLAAHLSDRRIGDDQDNIEAAIAAFDASGEIITHEASPTGWAVLQNNLAPLYAERERGGLGANQERAITMLETVLGIETLPGYIRSAAQYHLAEVYRARKAEDRTANLEMAVQLYRQAILGDPNGERWPVTVGRALGSVLIGLGRYEEARDALRIATRAAERIIGLGIDEAEMRDVMADAYDLYSLSAYAAAKTGDDAQALTLLSAGKARLLFTALAADRLDLPPAEQAELHRLRAELQQGEAGLEAVVRGDPSGHATDIGAIKALAAARDRILTLYDQGSRAALAQPTPATAVTEGALVAPVLTDYGAIILVATPGGKVRSFDAPGLSKPGFAGLIADGLRATWWNNGDPAQMDARLKALQPELGAGLGAPLRHALAAVGVAPGAPLVILPDGAGALLPIGLAADPASGRTLIEDYRTSYTPNLAALEASHRRMGVAGARRLALLLPPGNAELDFAPIEASMIGTTFGRSDSDMMHEPAKAALLAALGPHRYWHFTTHGSFDWSDPRQSGVLIDSQGDKLTLADLLESRAGIGEPRLVVLSACNTGLSDVRHNPDEFTGLPTGFLFAGAAGVVASLWPVNDLSTALLMARFYDLHLKQGLAPAEALRRAQLWLRDATLTDLLALVEAQRSAGLIDKSQADMMVEALHGSAAGKDLAAKPFAAPRYWGAFTIYGG